jgi:ATP-dependent exoDNAse (exonuclease V) beta subunit
MYPLENKANLYLKGFIDIVVYDESEDKYYIYDFKTSTRGWSEKEKKNQTKLQQILLYKKYFGKLYNIDIDKINVEFILDEPEIPEYQSPLDEIRNHPSFPNS